MAYVFYYEELCNRNSKICPPSGFQRSNRRLVGTAIRVKVPNIKIQRTGTMYVGRKLANSRRIDSMRSSRVVRASDCSCRNLNSPGFNPSFPCTVESGVVAKESVLNEILKIKNA